MFEGAIHSAQAGFRDGPSAPGALRPLEWSEIAARLAASRDLRLLLGGRSVGTCSFAGQAWSGAAGSGQGERDVNHGALGAGKSTVAISVGTVEEAAVGDQGTQ